VPRGRGKDQKQKLLKVAKPKPVRHKPVQLLKESEQKRQKTKKEAGLKEE